MTRAGRGGLGKQGVRQTGLYRPRHKSGAFLSFQQMVNKVRPTKLVVGKLQPVGRNWPSGNNTRPTLAKKKPSVDLLLMCHTTLAHY